MCRNGVTLAQSSVESCSNPDSPHMEIYKSYLKSKYLQQRMPNYGKWPHLPSKQFINLAVVEKGAVLTPKAKRGNSKSLTYGSIDARKRKSDITFADIATPNKGGTLPRFELVEGAPGVGKSTFAWEACRKWANGEILEEYELVILIRLRDESVRKAKCLGDLIQYPLDATIQKRVVEEITKTSGKGVLLLLEGYDELPDSLREDDSLFRNIIKGYEFIEGTVLLTSRPWASQPFLLPHYETNRPLSKRIEILGFTRGDIGDYLSCMLKNDPSLLQNIRQYLQLYPHIHSMMYIPLNCAIVLEVYRNSKEQNSLIPKTMTELYSSLVRSLLLRYLYDLPQNKDKIIKLDALTNLPACIKPHFDNLAKLAYEGICNKDQQIIFTEDEMPDGMDSLGLMQSSMELYVDIGTKKSYNFLHLTIQEFLAAYHISTLSLSEQVKFLIECEDAAAIFTEGEGSGDIVVREGDYDSATIMEGETMATACGNSDNEGEGTECGNLGCNSSTATPEYAASDITLSTENESGGYTTDTTVTDSENTMVTDCEDDEIASIAQNEGYNNTMVVLFLSGLSPSTLEKALRMDVPSETSLRFRAVDLHRLFEAKFKTFRNHSIDVAYAIYDPFRAYMLGYLIANSSCHWEAKIACYKDSLPMFISGISNSEDGLFGSKIALHIDFSSVQVPVLRDVCRLTTLPAACTLQKIVVRCTRLDAENDIVAALARMSKGNKVLKELQILSMFSNHDPHGRTNESVCALARALCENSTLETLNLECIGIGEDEATAFASMLKENSTLTELSILEYSFSPLIEFVEDWMHIFNLLSSSLEWNRTLRRLQVTTPYSFGSNKSHKSYYKAILAKCASSNRLFTSLRD